jgi:hypothetical protein
MRIRRVVAVLVSSTILCTACASVSKQGTVHKGNAAAVGSTVSVPGLPVATYDGPTVASTNAIQGITIASPSLKTLTTQVTVPAATAYANCLTGDAVCQVGIAPSITIGYVTSADAGTADSSGNLVPAMANTLAYILTWKNTLCIYTRPLGQSSKAPGVTQSPSHTCTMTDYIDATTGKVLYSTSG